MKGRLLRLQAVDINLEGMFVVGEEIPLAEGQSYRFKLDLPVGKKDIEGELEVVHLELAFAPEKQPGFVGRFVGLDSTDAEALESFLSRSRAEPELAKLAVGAEGHQNKDR